MFKGIITNFKVHSKGLTEEEVKKEYMKQLKEDEEIRTWKDRYSSIYAYMITGKTLTKAVKEIFRRWYKEY